MRSCRALSLRAVSLPIRRLSDTSRWAASAAAKTSHPWRWRCFRTGGRPTSDASFTPRDRQLLAHPPYARAEIPESYRRHIVDYSRREAPGTILVDTDARYLYYVLPDGKAIRYGVAVGEEAMAFSGVAAVGRMAEWPDWIPTPEVQARLGPYPPRIPRGPATPPGAPALYLSQRNTDHLYPHHP